MHFAINYNYYIFILFLLNLIELTTSRISSQSLAKLSSENLFLLVNLSFKQIALISFDSTSKQTDGELSINKSISKRLQNFALLLQFTTRLL